MEFHLYGGGVVLVPCCVTCSGYPWTTTPFHQPPGLLPAPGQEGKVTVGVLVVTMQEGIVQLHGRCLWVFMCVGGSPVLVPFCVIMCSGYPWTTTAFHQPPG